MYRYSIALHNKYFIYVVIQTIHFSLFYLLTSIYVKSSFESCTTHIPQKHFFSRSWKHSSSPKLLLAMSPFVPIHLSNANVSDTSEVCFSKDSSYKSKHYISAEQLHLESLQYSKISFQKRNRSSARFSPHSFPVFVHFSASPNYHYRTYLRIKNGTPTAGLYSAEGAVATVYYEHDTAYRIGRLSPY